MQLFLAQWIVWLRPILLAKGLVKNHGMIVCRSTCYIREDSQDRIGIAGQPEWDGQNETGRLGQAGQDKPNRTRRTGLLEKDYQDRTASQIRTDKIALPGHDC